MSQVMYQIKQEKDCLFSLAMCLTDCKWVYLWLKDYISVIKLVLSQHFA